MTSYKTFQQLAADEPSTYITQQIIDKFASTDTSMFLTKKQKKKINKWLAKIKQYDWNYSYTKGVIDAQFLPKTIKVVRPNRLSLPTEG